MDKVEKTETFWLQPNTTVLISGPTGSRKTTLASDLCANWSSVTRNSQELIDVHLFYDTYQDDLYEKISSSVTGEFKSHQGFPEDGFGFLSEDANQFNDLSRGRILILDDLGNCLKNPKRAAAIQHLFAIDSHHQRCNVIFIVHDLFGEKALHPIMKNTKYLFLTKSHYDFVSLQRSLFVGMPGVLKSASEQCFYSLKRHYLLIDNSADVAPKERIKSGLFATDQFAVIFRPL